jgi:hypothetical protein
MKMKICTGSESKQAVKLSSNSNVSISINWTVACFMRTRENKDKTNKSHSFEESTPRLLRKKSVGTNGSKEKKKHLKL